MRFSFEGSSIFFPRGCAGAAACLVGLLMFDAACGGSTAGVGPGGTDADDAGAATDDDASGGDRDAAAGDDASSGNDGGSANDASSGTDSSPPPGDAAPGDDGTPTRKACTGSFGAGLSTYHARLDGTVVAVIPPGQGKQCNGDSSHVHIQVLMNGAVYDVAANVDGNETEHDGPLVGGAWSEGWHEQDALDYPSNLSAHSSSFTLTGLSAVASEVEKQLANANHVSIYCTGYGPDGCHLVHRERNGRDGAIVINPLSASPHWMLFDFAGDNF